MTDLADHRIRVLRNGAVGVCAGDCDLGGAVTIDELVAGVRMRHLTGDPPDSASSVALPPYAMWFVYPLIEWRRPAATCLRGWHVSCHSVRLETKNRMAMLNTDTVIDRAAISERFDGDWELVAVIAEMFLKDTPRRLRAVREAVAAGDCEALQQAAHLLRGSISNFGAPVAAQAALELESMAGARHLIDAAAVYALLEREVARLTPVLVRLVRESGFNGAESTTHN